MYRTRILRQLRSLTRTGGAEDYQGGDNIHDSDIFSSYTMPKSSAAGAHPFESDDTTIMEDITEEPDHARYQTALDSEIGAFREVNFVEYEYSAIVITADNIGTLLQSFKSETAAQKFMRSIINTLDEDTVWLTGPQLSEIEHLWTAERSGPPSRNMANQSFRTRLTIAIRFTQNWYISKQLFYLAVSSDAVNILIQRSGRKRWKRLFAFPISWEALKRLLGNLCHAPPKWNLASAISRLGLRLAEVNTVHIEDSSKRGDWELAPGPKRQNGFPVDENGWFGFRLNTVPDTVQDRFYEVYNIHKIGRREPDEAFIRHAVQIDSQLTPHDAPLPFNSHDPDCYAFPGSFCIIQDDVASNLPPTNRCLIRFADFDDNVTLVEVQVFLESRISLHADLYKTERFCPGKPKSMAALNLPETYTKSKPDELTRRRIKEWVAHLRSQPRADQILFAGEKQGKAEPEPMVIDDSSSEEVPPFTNRSGRPGESSCAQQ